MSLPVRGAWIEIPTPGLSDVAKGSLPVRGAWIEINQDGRTPGRRTSLPVRGAWIEMHSYSPQRFGSSSSLPVRGAWIEIVLCTIRVQGVIVAPRAGSVD